MSNHIIGALDTCCYFYIKQGVCFFWYVLIVIATKFPGTYLVKGVSSDSMEKTTWPYHPFVHNIAVVLAYVFVVRE